MSSRSESNKPKKVPLGKAIQWSEEDLDRMCSPESLMADQPQFAQFWRDNAPPGFEGLLDAVPDETDESA